MPNQYPYEQDFQPQDGMNPNSPIPMDDYGSLDFVAGEQAGEDEILPAGNEFNFYENLAEGLKNSKLNSLSISLLSDIKDDRASRKELESTWNLAIKYLGLKVEEIMKIPFEGACGAYDATLATTLMNFLAIAKAELFPPSGPAKSKIEGFVTEEMEDRGERVEMFINYFLTVLDRPYYSDSDRLLLYVGLFGSAFRKVVMDPILKRPAPRLIKPQNLIISNDTTSILESTRITEEIFLTRKEVLLKQRAGIYVKDSLPENADDNDDMNSTVNKTIRKTEGVSESSEVENKSLFKFYEMHVELDPADVDDNFAMPDKLLIEDREGNDYDEYDDSDEHLDEHPEFGLALKEDADFDDVEDEDEEDDDKIEENIPRPYIVEICEATKKIVSIRRNWEEEDENFKREECYAHYYYLPGFGIYSIGLAQLQCSNAIVLTDILRQSIDTETRNIFPGGVRQKGMRLESNNVTPGPSTFIEIDTGGAPISDALMFIPSKGMSPGISQLRTELKTDTMNLGGASQQGHAATSNTPVGTMLAQIEINDRVPSTILISLHSSLAYELQLLKKLFQRYFGDEPYPFNVPGNRKYIMKEDFSDNINIVPVSDPNIITTTQRVIISEIILKMAMASPQLYDLREANERMLRAMKVGDIDKLLPKPQEVAPADPISENMAIMLGKGAKAGIQQDHQSHQIVHGALIQQLTQQAAQDPAAAQKLGVIKSHNAEHQAFQYLMEMQQAMGMQMPPEQALQDPQVQNQIAMAAAEATQKLQQEQQAQIPPPLDQNKIMMAEIEQRREASHLKHEEAQLRAETEAFIAQTQFESEKVKMDVNKELAKDKNEVTLTIAKMKQPHNLE